MEDFCEELMKYNSKAVRLKLRKIEFRKKYRTVLCCAGIIRQFKYKPFVKNMKIITVKNIMLNYKKYKKYCVKIGIGKKVDHVYIENVLKYHKLFKHKYYLCKNYDDFLNNLFLPSVLIKIRNCLENANIKLHSQEDGRVSSILDEKIIKKILEKNGIKFKNSKMRSWCDIAVYDKIHGIIPINIKTTTTTTCDNVGNFTVCVQSFTKEKLNPEKNYCNGEMSKKYCNSVSEGKTNTFWYKDYYFLVIDKRTSNHIIINGCNGLKQITSNPYNLPFQIKWNINEFYDFTRTTHKKFITLFKGRKKHGMRFFLVKWIN
jgi:hypothetical protein